LAARGLAGEDGGIRGAPDAVRLTPGGIGFPPTEDESMTERRCVFIVLVGGYEDLVEQPTASRSELDFLCFTDDRTLQSSSWQIRTIDPVLPADPARSSRHPKILAHHYLPGYDASLYIDNSVRLTRSPEEAFDELLGADAGFAAMSHAFRDTIADEFAAVIAARKDLPLVCAEQQRHYEQHYAGTLVAKPLVGAFLLRRHHRPDVMAAMELWWDQVLRYSRRDELSLPLALSESNLVIRTLDLDIRDNEFCEWPVEANRRPQSPGTLPAVDTSTSRSIRSKNER
jgi:hypothetical protein